MKKNITITLTALLIFLINSLIVSQSASYDISKILKMNTEIESLTAPAGLKTINSTSDNQTTRSSTSYKVLENGFVLEAVEYQIFTGSGWMDYQAEYNTYDNNFNLIETVNQFFDGTSLINYERMVQTYYANNLLESKLLQYWNEGQWEDDSKLILEYDTQLRISVSTNLLSDGAGGFLEYTRELHSYETNPIKEIIEMQLNAPEGWENLGLTIALFLDEELASEVTNYGWNGIEYEPADRFTYNYTSGILTEMINSLWNGSEWTDVAKQNYQYDAQIRLIEYVSTRLNENTQSWENVFKLNNTYYGDDSLMTIAQSGNVNSWENLMKVINLYSPNEKLTKTTAYTWEGNVWLPEAMAEYTYDINGNNNLYVEYAYESGEWSVYGRAIYSYIPTNPSDVDDDVVSAKDFKLYENFPNPFNPSTEIRYKLASESVVSIKIYDITGSQVTELVNKVQEAGIHGITFNASGLASGIYLYSITSRSLDGKHNFSDVKKMMMIK